MADKKNISSGAQKAEKLANGSSRAKASEKEELDSLANNGAKGAKTNSSKTRKQSATKTSNKKGASKKSATKKTKRNQKPISEKRAKKIKEREEKKLARKKLALERKQRRLEKKLEHKQKFAERKAELKQKRIERREARKERRDLLKSESKEARRERIAKEKEAKRKEIRAKRQQKIAERKAKREHALKVREQKRANRAQKSKNRSDRRTPGFGGWLASVITLGVTTLALATVLTFGWLNMNDMQANMAGGYTQSLYELNSVVDDLDVDLAKAKASSSSGDRVKVLCNIAVDSENAETVLERFPLEVQTTERLSSFINTMGDSAKQMLYTLANGGELSAEQIEQINYYYTTNAKVKSELNSLIERSCEKDMLMAMRGKDCAMSEVFANIQNNVFGTPEKAVSAPKALWLENMEEITAQKAEELAKGYFADYKVSNAKCTGEALGTVATYNVNLTVPNGEMLVQISKQGGKVVAFDSYKECTQHNFNVDRCIDIADEFLTKIGYNGLKPVWASENGTTCNIDYAPVQDGAVIYSDLIKVKVCEERGIVTGVEAINYVMRHKDRNLTEAAISSAQAKSVINGNIEVKSTRLAVIPFNKEDRLCYEFFGEMDGVEYYVYVDATTGEELEVRTVVGTAQGNRII